MEDFYFAYGYSENESMARRLYRRINCEFQRYNKETKSWDSAPEQGCIYIGEDWDYDEITEEQAKKIIEKM